MIPTNWPSSWHIFWHNISHFIRHIFWHSIWLCWHIFWHQSDAKSDIVSGNLADILPDILSAIWSDIYSTYSDITWHIFWHVIWHSIGPIFSSGILFGIVFGYGEAQLASSPCILLGTCYMRMANKLSMTIWQVVCVWNICTDEKLLLGRWMFLIWTRSAGVGIYDVAYNQGPRPTKLPDCMGYRAWSALRTCFNFSIVYGDRLSQEPDQDLFILQSLLAYGDRLSRLIHLGLLFSWLICTLKDSVPDGCLKRSNFV